MRRYQIVVLISIVCVPLALAIWLGWTSLQKGRQEASMQVVAGLNARVQELRARMEGLVRSVEDYLIERALRITGSLDPSGTNIADARGEAVQVARSGVAEEGISPGGAVEQEPGPPDTALLEELSLSDPLIRQAALIEHGTMVFPPRFDGTVSESEFYTRTHMAFPGGIWNEVPPPEGSVTRPDAGWRTWFWSDGQQYLYWWRVSESRIIAFELNRAAFLSRLASGLPPAFAEEDERQGRALIVNTVEGEVFVRWGAFEPAKDAEPLSVAILDTPLAGWHIEYFVDPALLPAFETQAAWFAVLASIAVLAVLGILMLILMRTLTRDLKEAGQRVSFVNQVSHELKTPLTNIRLYLDLLETELSGAGTLTGKAAERLRIIGGESERLSRLIHNVLSFARKDKGDLPRPRLLVWEEAILSCVTGFALPMKDRGIRIEYIRDERGADGPAETSPGASAVPPAHQAEAAGAPCSEAEIDPDWLSQILGNLLGNAEKYAAKGGIVYVAPEADTEWVRVRVADRGPGIPQGDRERIFLPFIRLGESLTDAAGGAGLGLFIARDLSRRHGGDLVLESQNPFSGTAVSEHAGPGCSFLLILPRRPPAAPAV